MRSAFIPPAAHVTAGQTALTPSLSASFFHPDCTVGTGISPVQHLPCGQALAGSTAGGEFRPALKKPSFGEGRIIASQKTFVNTLKANADDGADDGADGGADGERSLASRLRQALAQPRLALRLLSDNMFTPFRIACCIISCLFRQSSLSHLFGRMRLWRVIIRQLTYEQR